ncbi:hypothetical protein [Puia dinghuensis]|uniref:Uncharacterized protein n=1 Tax=Puia dinghuensis TaxID=1792502 RepID=A0A8J2UBN3_9BACT|nr:hypothetical protein [Puia dinghuensis]GGA93203.1 hypothetical protein GCM10011511_15770 [Puia dinghuensis]
MKAKPIRGEGLKKIDLERFKFNLNILLEFFSHAELALWIEEKTEVFWQKCSGLIPISPNYIKRFYAYLRPVIDDLKMDVPTDKIREKMRLGRLKKPLTKIVNSKLSFTLLAANHVPGERFQSFADNLAMLLSQFKKRELACWMETDVSNFYRRTSGKAQITLEFIEEFHQTFARALTLLKHDHDISRIRGELNTAYREKLQRRQKAKELKEEKARLLAMRKKLKRLRSENRALKAILRKHGFDIDKEMASVEVSPVAIES